MITRRMSFLKKVNIFTVILVVLAFATVLRVFNLASFSTPVSVAESAHGDEKKFEKPHDPPPEPHAEKKDEHASDAHEGDKKEAAAPAPPPAESPYGERAFSPAELDVLQSLAKRRAELDKREQQVVQNEALLKAAGSEVDRKIVELNKIKGELEALLNKQKTAEDERINSLVKIYENMKPKEASRIFDTLEMDILLSVIGKMSERKSSPILASMDPEKARQVTIQLAEQRKLPDAVRAAKDVPAPETPAKAPAH